MMLNGLGTPLTCPLDYKTKEGGRNMNRVHKTVEFEGTKVKVDIYVRKPSHEVIKRADRYKAKTWNQCIRDGVITKKELSILMEERGIWNKEKTAEEEKTTKRILELEKKLYKGDGKRKPKVSAGQQLAIEMRRMRIKLRDLISEKISLEENTSEALSENAKFDYLVSKCTYYKDEDKRVFESLDDYNTRSSDELAFAAATALGEMMYNLDASFEKNLPENKWLKKFELVDDELSLVNVDGELVDADGKLINEEGHFLDKDGHRTDKDGVPLDEEGNYVMVEYENDLIPKKTPKKRTSTKAKVQKEEVTEVTEVSESING